VDAGDGDRPARYGENNGGLDTAAVCVPKVHCGGDCGMSGFFYGGLVFGILRGGCVVQKGSFVWF